MTDEPIFGEPIRCELPGCDAIIEAPTAGAKRQRYCSAAHRVSARQQRRVERIATQADRAAESVHEPVEIIGAIGAGHSAPPVSRRGSVNVTPLRRPANASIAGAQQASKSANRRTALRRRTIAVLGVASVLAAGQQVAGMDRNPAPSSPGGLSTVEPPAPDVRADRATVERGLVMVTAQLDMIAQTMDQWRERHGTSTPPQVLALMERQRVVEQLKATVVSKLAAVDTLERAAADRAAAEQALAAIDHALNTTPTPGSPQQAETVGQLTDQKRMWSQRRDQLATANTQAQRAVAEPMPDLSDHTSRLTQQVLAITGPPVPAPADRKRRPLAAVAPREHAAEERPPVYTSAPPRPTTIDPDISPKRDESTGGDSQLRSAAGITQTSPAATSLRRVAPVRYADVVTLDKDVVAIEAARRALSAGPADRHRAEPPPSASRPYPTRPSTANRPAGTTGWTPTDSGTLGPPTGPSHPDPREASHARSAPLPGWAQQARKHLEDDMTHIDQRYGSRTPDP